MAISKRLRFEILRRDGFKCRYCHASEALLTVDHVTPVSLGGTHHPSNLVAACDDCNSGKSSSLPAGVTVADAVSHSGDSWQDRDTEAVVNAAVHVWQSFWMPENLRYASAEQVKEVRASALELYPYFAGADDLMRVAEEMALQNVTDLTRSLRYSEYFEHPNAGRAS